MPISRRLILTLALAAAMAGASAPAAFAAGRTGTSLGGFSVRPLQFDPNNPATRAYFIQTVADGHRFSGDAVVTNLSDQTIQLFVYPVDGLTSVTSGTVYANHVDRLRKAGRWLTPAVREVTLAPHQQQSIPFTVNVPGNALPGDHVAGLAFENAHTNRTTTHGHFAVIQILRVVVGVQIRVPGPAAPQLALTGAVLEALPGTPVGSVVIDLANRGRLLCKPTLSVALNSGAGSQAVTRQLRTVLPGDAIAYPFAWPKTIAPGRYVAHVAATGCGAPVSWAGSVSTGTRLVAAGHPYAVSPITPASPIQAWMLALIGIGGALAGVVVAGGVYAIRRRRGAR